MAKVPCWRLLSDTERAECTGELREFACCSKFAWPVEGIILEDWNGRVLPQISNLISQNYKRVFGKSGVQALLSLQLYLLSSTKDPTTALPTIYIVTADKRAASKARKLLQRHELFKSLNTGFDIEFEGKSIFMRAGETDASGLGHSAEYASLCGAPVAIATLSEKKDKWRRATILCTVKIEEHYYVVLPAHVFCPDNQAQNSPPLNNIVESQADLDDSDSFPDWNSDDSSHEGSNQSLGATCDWSCPDRSALLSQKYAVYLNFNKNSTEISESSLELLGHFDPRDPLPSSNFEFDYALVELNNSRFFKENSVDSLGTSRIHACSYSTDIVSGTVLLASGSCEVRNVKISSSLATLIFPWSSTPVRVWELTYTLPEGDSGSLVIDYAGNMIGMAIATIPENNITYVIPAADILKDIWFSKHDLANKVEEGQPELSLLSFKINERPEPSSNIPIQHLGSSASNNLTGSPHTPSSVEPLTQIDDPSKVVQRFPSSTKQIKPSNPEVTAFERSVSHTETKAATINKISNPPSSKSRHPSGTCFICEKYGYHYDVEKEVKEDWSDPKVYKNELLSEYEKSLARYERRMSDLLSPRQAPSESNSQFDTGHKDLQWTGANKDVSARPIWLRAARKYLLPETLNAYQLDWEFEKGNEEYILIKKNLSEDFIQELFEHTQAMLRSRAQTPLPAALDTKLMVLPQFQYSNWRRTELWRQGDAEDIDKF